MGVVLGAAACSGGGPSTTPDPTRSAPTSTSSGPSAPATAAPDLAAARVSLVPVSDIGHAIVLATRPDDPRLYIGRQDGIVEAVLDGAASPTPTLDLSSLVSFGGEQGLLGMTFSPDGALLYVHFSGSDGETEVIEYAVTGGRSQAIADPATARTILTVDQPQPNHNGGALLFGPDGMLYLGLGDGGAAGDSGAGHAPDGNGQTNTTLLGKILRIDPSGTLAAPYQIPDGNPFAAGGGRREIFATGLRNPWRFSFDSVTGDLWIGDVGQGAWEEIDHVPFAEAVGANFGWPILEGSHAFRGDSAPGSVLPVLDISHDDGDCAVVGGYVYRGSAIPDLRGAYVFSDNCNGKIRALRLGADGSVALVRDLGVSVVGVTSFGEGADGELYVLTTANGITRLAPA